MRLVRDEVLHYGWPSEPQRAYCHLRIFEAPGQTPIVIIGQLEDSPGPSVVNAVEFIADIVKARFFEDGREFMLFDYWPKGAGLGLDQPEQYKLIELRPEGPRHHDPEWPQRWTREEMEELVGTELPSYLEGRYRADLGGQDQAG